jgi:hypothetical protein
VFSHYSFTGIFRRHLQLLVAELRPAWWAARPAPFARSEWPGQPGLIAGEPLTLVDDCDRVIAVTGTGQF